MEYTGLVQSDGSPSGFVDGWECQACGHQEDTPAIFLLVKDEPDTLTIAEEMLDDLRANQEKWIHSIVIDDPADERPVTLNQLEEGDHLDFLAKDWEDDPARESDDDDLPF